MQVDQSRIIYVLQNKEVRFTLPFVIDLPCGDDFVEDGGERLILSDDPRWNERGHDELSLSDVGFHGNPGREASGQQVRWKKTRWR